MTKTLIADMAATLIEAAKAGESLDRAEAILRVARFGTGAIRAFGGAALMMALAAMASPAHAGEISTGSAITVGLCLTGIGICLGVILAVHAGRRRARRAEAERREEAYKLYDRAARAEALRWSDLQSLGRAVFAKFLDCGGNLESWHCVIEIEAKQHGVKYRDGMRTLDGRKRTSPIPPVH